MFGALQSWILFAVKKMRRSAPIRSGITQKVFPALVCLATVLISFDSSFADDCVANGTNQSCTISSGTTFSNGTSGIWDNGSFNLTNYGTLSASGAGWGSSGVAALASFSILNVGSINVTATDGDFFSSARAIITNDLTPGISTSLTNIGSVTAYSILSDPASTHSTESYSVLDTGTNDDALYVQNLGIITAIADGGNMAQALSIVQDSHAPNSLFVTNSGTIETHSSANNTNFSLSQAISVLGLGSISMINSGNIITIADGGTFVTNAFGILTEGYGSVTSRVDNSGLISSTAVGSTGTFSISRAHGVINDGSGNYQLAVSNSGTIQANASGASTTNMAFGVVQYGNGTLSLSNSGTINVTASGSGALAYAVYVDAASNIVNSGTIFASTPDGANAYALYLDQYGPVADSITLLPGSKLIGKIHLGGGSDVVTFAGGSHNLTFDASLGATIVTNAPYAISGSQISVVDPTSFASSITTLQSTTRAISSIVPEFNSNSGDQKSSVGLAYVSNGDAAKNPSAAVKMVSDAFGAKTDPLIGNTAIWTRAFGGRSFDKADGALVSVRNLYYGGAVGLDRRVDATVNYGGYIGGVNSTSTFDDAYGNIATNMAFAGAYARQSWGSNFVKIGFQSGYGTNSSTRYTNNNLLTSGVETATASYSNWYLSPELSAGHTYSLGTVLNGDFSLTPVAQARYLYGSFGSYTESGGTDSFSVNSHSAQSVEENLSVKASHVSSVMPGYLLRLDITGGILASQNVKSDTISASLLGQSISFSQPGSSTHTGAKAGLGAELTNGKISVSAGGDYIAQTGGNYDYSGRLDVNVRF